MKVTLSRNSIDATSTPLSVVDHFKYLGIILQSDLNWNKHVEQKVSKASSMLALIQGISSLDILYIKTKELAYKALVRPQLEYAVWSPWQQGLTKMIEKVQQRTARFVLNDYSYNSSVTHMLSKDSLESRREKSHLAIYIFYKSIFGSVAFPICEYVFPFKILTTRGSHSYKIQSIFTHAQAFLPSINHPYMEKSP